MTENLAKWIEENKLTVSESSIEGLDTVEIEGVGLFLCLSHKDGKIIDEDFSFLLSDEEYEILDEDKVNYVLFEFGGKFYYSSLNRQKNEYGEPIYRPQFNDFKYIGKCSETPELEFVNLGIHDEYEMLSGSGSCGLWCKKAQFLGHKAIGVCDKNSLSSSLSMQSYADKYKLKTVLGETIVVARNYDKNKDIQETFDLKLYALNKEGWNNLLLISKTVNVDFEGFIPSEILCEYGEGICCVIPKESEFNYLVKNERFNEANKILKIYQETFDKVYYQIDTLEYSSRQLFYEHLRNIDNYIIHYRDKVEPILINDSYYLDKEEHELKSTLHKVSGKVAPEAKDQYFKSVVDTLNCYPEWHNVEELREVIIEGIRNTVKLTDSVDLRIDSSERKIPHYEIDGKEIDSENLFFSELQKGIDEKLVGKVDGLDSYLERINTECELIVPNGLCDYFLILWDICNWCKKNDIMVGPGRGSVCGSLVAYCLGITSVDPLKYQLYFERFLNKSRIAAYHTYTLTMEDGSERIYGDGDKIELMDGTIVEASTKLNWNELDIL